MLPCANVGEAESQLKPLSATADLDLALTDLVGDLASYRPGGKVIILEGGGDSDFDQRVVSTLFPEVQEHANLISGTNKVRVRALLEILEAAAEKGHVPFKFFSITDRDSDPVASPQRPQNSFSSDVYHIENYFLVPKYILRVLEALQTVTALNEDALRDELRECAKETLPQVIRHELAEYANDLLVKAINTGTDPNAEDLAAVLSQSVTRSLERLNALETSSLGAATLAELERKARSKYTESIADGTWASKVPGRTVLKRFVGRNVPAVSYEVFRNLVLAQMKDDGYRPPGMKSVIDQVLLT